MWETLEFNAEMVIFLENTLKWKWTWQFIKNGLELIKKSEIKSEGL